MTDKQCTMREAIGRHVPDGASVVLGTALESLLDVDEPPVDEEAEA